MRVDLHVDPQQNGKNPCVRLRKSRLAASGRPASRARPIDSFGSLTFRAVPTAKNQVALTSPLLRRAPSGLGFLALPPGERGVVGLTAAMGWYCFVSMMLKVDRCPAAGRG